MGCSGEWMICRAVFLAKFSYRHLDDDIGRIPTFGVATSRKNAN
jgi:hypothetical protein